jgi:hypothetical protein
MPLQNRVTPRGELIAVEARGLVYANRGCLHDDAGRIRSHHNGRRWIACRLQFRGRHRSPLMQPGRFTELFFLDEATAFAAGHRPCALCRREDYNRFMTIVGAGPGAGPGPGASSGADAFDERLHAERWDASARVQRLHAAELAELPDGAFVLGDEGEPRLVRGGELLAWGPAGYGERRQRRAGRVQAITPPTLIGVLRAGWDGAVPLLHPSAG